MVVNESSKIVLGSKRYQNSVDVVESEKVSLSQNSKEFVEYDRSIDVTLPQVFDDERQKSNIFRPTTKYAFIFKNQYSGETQYQPYSDYLYYVNLESIVEQIACNGTTNNLWQGFPQYTEFDFIRNDNDKVGYTTGVGNHQLFVNKSATTYNWTHYLSYPFSNNPNKEMTANDTQTLTSWTWVANEGIPFTIASNENSNILFKCPMEHGLNLGEYVELSINYNGQTVFPIESLGNGGSGSDEYYFSLYNVGYTGTTFDPFTIGTLKRVLDPQNIIETKSTYYVRQNKILTNVEDAVLTKAAFDNSIFNLKTKVEKPIYYGPQQTLATPTTLPRTSILEGSQNYTLSFNRDIDVTNLIDNQKRPITELFFTTIWKGYWGWTNKIKQGHEFNTPLFFGIPSQWWNLNNTLSDTNIPAQQYSSNGVGPFTYMSELNEGDVIDGDFCEWNDYDQKERVISRYVNKITFNQNFFLQNLGAPQLNSYGYYYYPHNSIQIKVFSEYIEEGDVDANIVGIPDYAFYSNTSNGFRWRDIYPYGFIDTEGVGLDYPFTNGKHYPYTNTIFRLFPEGIGNLNINEIVDPTTDDCE
jgi:hypothetical protein